MPKDDKQPLKEESKSNKMLEDLQQKVNELTEALQRERADSTNLRRRTEEEKSKLSDFYKANIVRQFLPLADSLERLLQHISTDSKDHPWKEGAEKISKQAQKILSDLGVEKIKTEGEEFDPKYHEAVGMEEGDGDTEVVAEELQAGYTLGDEVVRHAFVKVKMEKKNE
jgi:molecular chaperone GrpE